MLVPPGPRPKIISGQEILSNRLKGDKLPLLADHERLTIFPSLLGLQQGNLLEDMGRRRLRRYKRQL